VKKQQKPKSASAAELLARDERGLKEFIEANPTDVALWPNPFAKLAETLTRRRRTK